MNIYSVPNQKSQSVLFFKSEHLNTVTWEKHFPRIWRKGIERSPQRKSGKGAGGPVGLLSGLGIRVSRAASGCFPFCSLGPFLCHVDGELFAGLQLAAALR